VENKNKCIEELQHEVCTVLKSHKYLNHGILW